MTTLSFSLAPKAIYQLHDALMCLSKFDDSVAIEAEFDLLRLSVLNSTKTAYSAFAFEADSFFESYSFGVAMGGSSSRTTNPNKFSCQVLIKALVSAFKGRTSGRDKDTSVERCEVELQESPEDVECRLIIRMICGLGVIKLYKLAYESIYVQHATFDRSKSTNTWCIDPKYLKEITDHFGPSAEQLDVFSDHGKVVFTSFTTKISDGKEILRQPVHTSVAIDKTDFDYYLAEDRLHVVIYLKDFKAAIAHADTVDSMITARFTRPCRPLQFAYEFEGVRAEYTLMTRGEAPMDGTPSSSRAVAPQLSARQTPAPVQASQRNTAPDTRQMPPPPRSRSVRPLTGSTRASQSNAESGSHAESHAESHTEAHTESQRPPQPSMEFDSLFVPADDDRQWDVPNEEDEAPAEDELGWDATGEQTSMGPGLRDTEPGLAETSHEEEEMRIPPTQRMSQLHGLGLFD
ncbi:DNA repair protein rad9 [Aspergillus heteromorphus CBS 117.55]|uniref:DNA repair protein rad9 n=1 Tax=Aspergillus heteromorphus CBS 117.55 TaxID=1448321 RepID=A0A317VGZ9_9EURO|nr:DNA repair protein rad9 [Aspergillus heteromorphus CBS 117.55]PWY73646.1 DNA repair protein rad9 [Aspergillus heteromorphus CBS 117.55]